jgi:polyhydroxyalkanoate synthesis regulator phasin
MLERASKRPRKDVPMIMDDLRRTVEGLIGTLTPAKAQQLAKDMLEPGAAKEQVAKTTADLMEWSLANRERLTASVRREISEQLRSVGGLASRAELDALAARVRDLERATERATPPRKPARAASKRTASASTRRSSSGSSRSTGRAKPTKRQASTDEGPATSSDG